MSNGNTDTPSSEGDDAGQRLKDAFARMIAFHKEMADHPRRDPRAFLFQARDNREKEAKVMMHFFHSHGRAALDLHGVEHLEDGRDPPDFRCHDGQARKIGIEIVELVNPRERKTNAYRLKKASEGGHENSLEPPLGATEGMRRMFRERTVMTVYSEEAGLQEIHALLLDKDHKIPRQKSAMGGAWDYDQIAVLVYTTNYTIASGAFYRGTGAHTFGPFATINRAFLVAEPFIDIGDGIIELKIQSSAG